MLLNYTTFLPKIQAITRTRSTGFHKKWDTVAQVENERVKPFTFELDKSLEDSFIRFILIPRN